MRIKLLALTTLCACVPLSACVPQAAVTVDASSAPKEAVKAEPAIEPFMPYTMKDDAIPDPIRGLKGNPAKGKKLAINGAKGNCLACHQMPIPEEEFHGEVGPSLLGLGSRYNEGQIRMRIVNIQELIPSSLMPPFYKNPAELTQVAKKFQGQTILTAQEVEDVVAYLTTLK